MANAPKVIDTALAITADRDIDIDSSGTHGAASFYVDVTAITRTTGTLDVFVRWKSSDGNTIDIASTTGIIATGLVRLDLAADFSATRMGIPEPNSVDWDLIGDTTAVSGNIYAGYGD